MKFRYGLIFLAGAGVFGWGGTKVLNHWDRNKDPDRLAFILNISHIPPSVRNLDCDASATTDVIVTCSFEIDPRDYDKVLAGNLRIRSSWGSVPFMTLRQPTETSGSWGIRKAR
ncbi:exported hypothetical protein [Rhizobium mesoamericanum STM3625]|uniref:Uncharacterized protein n=1 Tax=Rhizobium mesoamericanum STM3625 TaxID=1211777 RepID=K0Q545_9HYPH|nr:exported hypothetical protein [Rhizobium mesoamericanum STM3625]